MRIGLAGTGRIGAFHATTLAALAEVDSLVVADVDSGRAREVADRLGVEQVDHPDALFGAGIDALVIAAATDAHASLIVTAVEAGIPTFCEKPVAPDVDGTPAVLDKVRRPTVPVQSASSAGSTPGTAPRGPQWPRVAGLGAHVAGRHARPRAAPPEVYMAHSGGFFRDCSCTTSTSCAGSPARRSSRSTRSEPTGEPTSSASTAMSNAAALLTLSDSSFSHVAGTRYNAAATTSASRCSGPSDSISVGLDDRLPLRSAEPGVTFPSGVPYPMFMERFHAAYVAELTAFTDCGAGHMPSPCTVADALEAFYVASVRDVRAEHRPVLVAEVRR